MSKALSQASITTAAQGSWSVVAPDSVSGARATIRKPWDGPSSTARFGRAGLYLWHPFRPHQPLLCCNTEWGVGATISIIPAGALYDFKKHAVGEGAGIELEEFSARILIIKNVLPPKAL